jgi:hypothetical protein
MRSSDVPNTEYVELALAGAGIEMRETAVTFNVSPVIATAELGIQTSSAVRASATKLVLQPILLPPLLDAQPSNQV